MDHRLLRATWLGGLGAIIGAPTFAFLALPSVAHLGLPTTGGLWQKLSTITGLLALSALVCAAVLPSRLRSLNRAFGIESVIDVHRFLGIVTASLIFAHLACVVAADPANITLLDLTTAPGRARAATVSTLALIALAVLTVLRNQARLSYELWKLSHVTLAATALLAAGLHVWLLDQLVRDAVIGTMFMLFAVLLVLVLGHRWVWRPLCDPSTEFVVRDVRRENRTVSTLVLEPCARVGRPATSWAFAPGQFAWIRLDRSVMAEEHPFTIASSAHSDATEFTIRHTGDFTRALRRLPVGATVWVDGPHGAFTNDAEASAGFVMIAGGVGITPMMSMLRTAAHRNDPRPYRLVVVASAPEDLLFRGELAELRQLIDLEVTEVLRRPVEGWSGHTGDINVDLLSAVLGGAHNAAEVDYFICGPPALVTDALGALDVLGAPLDRIHTEQFDLA
ncbi:ferredoxin reductase family protein [Pseudonocardia zijingensis]|jgi:3-phenylpropionate/trans-cinnamate dioxygenase ferredoxin reductase subunit|uniref:Ferredoxin reductase family protein n=1 Tax=Pseudonocardia zijingensis TaxID=153376 RepID=A0ABN1N683_9PSEU